MAPKTPDVSAAPHGSVAHTLALLHPWIDFVPQQQRRLGLFVCFALAIHIAAFFFIRIDATRAELQHPARIHLTIESPHRSAESEGSGAFLDRLTDPRSFLLPVAPLSRLAAADSNVGPTDIDFRLGTQQLPTPAPAQNDPLAPDAAPSLQEQVIDDMRPGRQPFSYDEKALPPLTKTVWQWDPELGLRQPLAVPALPSPVSDIDISPTELRVAILPGGGVDHVLLEETCQKPELDQQAILAARKLRFPAVDQPGLAWALIIVYWHPTAPPQEVIEATPPSP